MGPTEATRLLRRQWWVIAIASIVGAGLAAAASAQAVPTYTATTRLFFAAQTSESASDLAQGSSFTERQMDSIAQVATSPLVLREVALQLGKTWETSDLTGTVSSYSPDGTVIVYVSATSTDPTLAAKTANLTGAQLSITISDLYPRRVDGSEAVKATVLAPATVPVAPSSPNTTLNIVIGLVLGLLTGVAVALTRERIDTRIRTEDDLASLSNKPLLGSVAYDPSAPTQPVADLDGRSSRRAEDMRRLRTNLDFVPIEKASGKAILLTSSLPGEGKTTTVLNLAASLASAGNTVVVVDADLRRPSAAAFLGLESSAGLTSVLTRRSEVADLLQPTKYAGFSLLASGPVPPNPSELLTAARMGDAIAELCRHHDYVLVDSPPMLPVADAAIVSRWVDGTVVVVGADKVNRKHVHMTLEMLSSTNSRILGLVLNRRSRAKHTDGYGGYSYSPLAKAAIDGPAASRRLAVR